MSNDIPPRACLAGFGFMKMVLDPGQLGFGGDRTIFMSPELLLPWKYGFTESTLTPEADIYAFGSVIYQVCEHDRGYPLFFHIVQVLTGELPFSGHGLAEVALSVVHGARPTKPKNGSAIGFSDSLWSFVERCWDGEIESRPKVAEVVGKLKIAAAGWDRVTPPWNSASPKSASDSTVHCEFGILILP